MADVAPSDERVACIHAATCGGCPLIELTYGEQLARKHDRVARAFERFPLLRRIAIQPVIPAADRVGYRSRTKLVVGPAGVGLYAAGGHTLVDLPGCRVLPADVAAVVQRLRDAIARGDVVTHDEAASRLGLRGVDLRGSAVAETVLVTLIVDEDEAAKASARALGVRLAADEPRVAGVFLAPHTGTSPRLLAPPDEHVAGGWRVVDRVGPVEYVAGPGAFVQAHRGQAAAVHALVAAHVAPASGTKVLDVYGGGGGIGLALARAGARVTLIESFAPAVDDARASAEKNGVTLETVLGDAGQSLDAMRDRRAFFQAIVLNPPRRGCDAMVRERVARLRPERIAYVSCDPETLARDLDHFRRLGYATVRATPVDMIPLTDQVETVALLARAPTPHPTILHEDAELLVIDRWPDEPVAPEPSRRGLSTLERVRGRAAWLGAVVLSAPGDEASGVTAFLRSGSPLTRWTDRPRRTTLRVLARGITREAGRLDRGLTRGEGPGRYKRVAVVAGQSVLDVTLEGGGAGRACRELAAIGHPVVGDVRHGHAPTNRHVAERFALGRLFAHVTTLELEDPRTRTTLRFDTPIAPDLALVLARMEAADSASR